MINFDTFRKWAEKHFTNVEVSGQEIKVNSCFVEDTKNHMWCNPSKNAYHCWKSDKSGNLIELVSHVSGCSFSEASSMLRDNNDLRELEARLDRFFKEKEEKKTESSLSLPPSTFLISKMSGHFRHRAEQYLSHRKLSIDGLYFCIAGKYQNRIIIPYYDKDGKLIYWNGRDITGNAPAKYKGPDAKEVNIGKGDVIYISSWKENKVYLAEGELDAMSLTKCGLNGAACGGKVLSDKQIELLKPYAVCVSLDADKSGEEALNNIGDKLIRNGVSEVSYVLPPVAIKDWNKMLVDLGDKMVKLYISKQEKPFTPWTSNSLRLNNFKKRQS